MKNFTLSLATMMAISTFVIAADEKNSYPTSGPDSYQAIHGLGDYEEGYLAHKDRGLYLGLAYGRMNANEDISSKPVGLQVKGENDINTIMFQAGYLLNKYIAIEGRYWRTFGDIDYTITSSTHPQRNDSGSFKSNGEDAYGFYAKPMIPITEAFDIYALLGYAAIKDIVVDDDGFSWGVGASYTVDDNFSIFVDYTGLYDDEVSDEIVGYTLKNDISLNSWNFGINYKF